MCTLHIIYTVYIPNKAQNSHMEQNNMAQLLPCHYLYFIFFNHIREVLLYKANL